MIAWIRRYTLVLPREFGVLYGLATGLVLSAIWAPCHVRLSQLEAANAGLYWLGFFAAAYLAGLGLRLAAAWWMRHFIPVHQHGRPTALKASLGRLRFRHVVQAYLLFMLAVLLLARFADLTRYQAYLGSRWATVAFAVWLAVQTPLLRFKDGSAAHAFFRWWLAPLLAVLTFLAWQFGAYY
jgi:hypothetical protein